jgi:SAM-dependent methyltransferase
MPTSNEENAVSPVTNDGSLVEVYRRVSGTAEVEAIAGLLEPGSSVLDLGAGVGRIADPLAELGHQVVAVDDSADMLAHVGFARTIQARIEELRLPEKFDAVLLASSLVNYPGSEFRRSILATVAHHLKPTGKAIIQWRSSEWFGKWPPGSYQRTDGQTLQTMTIHANDGDSVSGEFTLEVDGQKLTQSFEAHRVSGDELRSILEQVGMQLDTTDPDSSEWLEASLQH